MSTRTRHPFTGALYELCPDGSICVTDGSEQGIFNVSGQWIAGELRQCDPQLCVWVGHTATDSSGDSTAQVAIPRRID